MNKGRQTGLWTATGGPWTRVAAGILGPFLVAMGASKLSHGASLWSVSNLLMFGVLLLIIAVRGRLGPKSWGAKPKDPPS